MYAFFVLIFASLFIGTTPARALIYDEASISNGSLYVTRLNYEDTTYFECKKSCKHIDNIPASSNPKKIFPQNIIKNLSTNLPKAIRQIQNQDGRYLALWRSDGKKRVIQIIDSIANVSYTKVENIKNEILTEETKLLGWKENILYYISDISGVRSIYKIDTSTLKEKELVSEKITDNTFEVADFMPLSNGKIAYIANPNDSYIWKLFIKDTNNKVVEIDSDVSYSAGLVEHENLLIFSKRTNAGFEINSSNIESYKNTKLKTPKTTDISYLNKISYETKTYENTSGILIKKIDDNNTKNKTLLVWLHGGPHRQVSKVLHPFRSYGNYDNALSYIVSKTGNPVLKLDYPGSTGHGNVFANLIYRNVGNIDVTETTLTIKKAKQELGVNKVILVGTSYGGYLGLKMISEKQNIIDGVFAINAVTDWKILFETIYGSPLIKLFGNKKENILQKFWDKADIYNSIQNIDSKKPILIGWSSNDTNIPLSQSVSMVNYLLSEDKNVDTIVFDNEDHSLKKKSSVESFCKEVLGLLGIKKPSCNLE